MKDIIGLIVNSFTPKELDILKLRDSNKKLWSFQEQLEGRFLSKYSSFASLEELKKHIISKVKIYKPLLNEETAIPIREILLDELEVEVSISYPTHLWNKEMFFNLNKIPIDPRVSWAVEQIISSINPEVIKQLTLNIEGREFDLKTLLISRWSRGWLIGNKRIFKRYLSRDHIHNPHNIHRWNEKKTITKIEFQSFLENLDILFAYPVDDFPFKRNIYKNDEGMPVGGFPRLMKFFNILNGFQMHVFIFIIFILIVIIAAVYTVYAN